VSDVTYEDVDHFRPKNKVEECSDHPSHRWLVFTVKRYNGVIEELRRLIDDRSEYSAAAKAILRQYSRDPRHDWIDEDVLNAS
jgi:hypothetical protein